MIAGVSGLGEVEQDGLGSLCAGRLETDGRAVCVRFLRRRLSEDELVALCAPIRTSPPAAGLARIIHAGVDADSRAYVLIEADVTGRLSERRARGDWLSAAEAGEILVATCEALAALHARDGFYGTITPASIARAPKGWRLVDPGVAAVAVPLPPLPEAAIDGVLTYTAPELLQGSACSPAADVFSLAATVIELLSGRAVCQWGPGDRASATPASLAVQWGSVRLPTELRRALEAAVDPVPGRRPDAHALARSAASLTAPAPAPSGAGVAPAPGAAPPAPAPPAPPAYTGVLDDDVQFTVYRPRSVQPNQWYSLLAFAHKSEPFVDELLGQVDPIEEVRRQASSRLGQDYARYGATSDDSSQPLPRGSSLTFVPEVDGVEFNPPRRTFGWMEPVHQEEFRLRAASGLDGQRARGRLSVYFGSILIAEVSLAFRVSSGAVDAGPAREDSRPYRKIFISYSHRDRAVVEQVETFLSVVGDDFLRDARALRAGEVWEERLAEMINEADIFQLFWSTNSMRSPFVHREWTYALSLRRPSFIRPTYWETPMPEIPEQDLPPDELRRLQFRYLPAAVGGAASPGGPGAPPAGALGAPPGAGEPPAGRRWSRLGRLPIIGSALAAVAVVAVLATISIRTAHGAPTADFDRTATVVDGGHGAQVSGPITCPATDTAQLRVTISEASRDAGAAATWSGVCAGAPRTWTATASVAYGPGFVPGCARGTGVALVRRGGTTVERFTWQNRLTLTGLYGVGSTSVVHC
jgi:serine/threonine protein kinase